LKEKALDVIGRVVVVAAVVEYSKNRRTDNTTLQSKYFLFI
jgi:hypothetical protein